VHVPVVVLEKETDKPVAVVVALTENVPEARALLERVPKVIVWFANVKVNVMFADVAEL